jgi:serine phosphatase RsbU (regulator of sigma subunit)
MSSHKRHSVIFRNRFLIRKTWKYISGLGGSYSDKIQEMRSDALSNQLNFILFVTMSLLLVYVVVVMKLTHDTMSTGTIRVAAMVILCFLNLVLAHFKLQKISKYSLIFLPPLVFLVIPTLTGFVEEEGYTYNAYFLIAASILPQLLLSSEKNKLIFWISMVYYFILVAFIDVLMFNCQKEHFNIVDSIKGFYAFYKIAHIGIFVFINIAIYHLRKVNFRFEDRLNEKNEVLNKQNKELRMQREKIREQKDIIEQNGRAVRDSINYAGRIQQAVLQPLDFLDEWSIPNFILYKPKAIVSGDFYWGIRKNDKIYLAAGDCTGHGVPGAFMCMLGLAFLDDIFSAGEIENAAAVLNALRESVTSKLRQKGNIGEMRDGMDISFCIVDMEAGKLEFAGANNPLYLVRNGTLTKIPADKIPIGLYLSQPEPYTNNSINIQKDDCLYLFSDGYADQFGGRKGKKFMYKQFQELLLRHCYKPMKIQKEILDNHFEKWKGGYDQVDDVLVMGLSL